jgi:hypothetical protein
MWVRASSVEGIVCARTRAGNEKSVTSLRAEQGKGAKDAKGAKVFVISLRAKV